MVDYGACVSVTLVLSIAPIRENNDVIFFPEIPGNYVSKFITLLSGEHHTEFYLHFRYSLAVAVIVVVVVVMLLLIADKTQHLTIKD